MKSVSDPYNVANNILPIPKILANNILNRARAEYPFSLTS